MATIEQAFLTPNPEGHKYPTFIVGKEDGCGLSRSGEASCGTAPTCADAAREAAIQNAAREVEHHMAEVAAINNRDPHTFDDFADAAMARQRADFARKRMEALIAGRSPEQVARMERERGLDRPACANDARTD